VYDAGSEREGLFLLGVFRRQLDLRIGICPDSPLEEARFEPSVRRQRGLCKHRDRRRSQAPRRRL